MTSDIRVGRGRGGSKISPKMERYREGQGSREVGQNGQKRFDVINGRSLMEFLRSIGCPLGHMYKLIILKLHTFYMCKLHMCFFNSRHAEH